MKLRIGIDKQTVCLPTGLDINAIRGGPRNVAWSVLINCLRRPWAGSFYTEDVDVQRVRFSYTTDSNIKVTFYKSIYSQS